LKITLRATTAAKIVVWKEDDLFHVRLSDSAERAQVCLAVDLFEVIAELTGLDLEVPAQAAEATNLAESAREQLRGSGAEAAHDGDEPSAQSDLVQ
jgi:hypothetical protein